MVIYAQLVADHSGGVGSPPGKKKTESLYWVFRLMKQGLIVKS